MDRGRYIYMGRPGRTMRSSRDRLYFPEEMLWFFRAYMPDIEIHGNPAIEPAKPEEEEKPKPKPLKVKEIDLNVDRNNQRHSTDKYEIGEPHTMDGQQRPAQLITRRGDDFDITVTFDREYNRDSDQLKVMVTFGKEPKVSKGTLHTLPVAKGLKNGHWSAAVENKGKEIVKLTVRTPPTCLVGKWKVHILTSVVSSETAENGKPEVEKHTHDQPVYVLFNAWCKADPVYMESEIEKEEYVLNDSGRIFSGSSRRIAHKPWNFGQFEDVVLDCSLYLLDQALAPKARGDIVRVCRAISALVNSSDDNGVLIGNWSGQYEGGTAPTAWVSSAAILEEYWETKQPVAFGQCWVFSGCVTTVCRALGIPTRSVTNFSSAHDCDGSITIDYHWNIHGRPETDMNEDSVWNFHVWNEAWMTRADLKAGFNGWQAFDATPQETSGGIYCAGPSPVKAIKEGLVNQPYDTAFIFAEVNADKVQWVVDAEDNKFPTNIKKHHVGRFISTKKPEGMVSRGDYKKRMDITRNYKFKEESQDERAAVHRANAHSTVSGLYDMGPKDVKFEIMQDDNIFVGSPFEVVFNMQNKSREARTITVDVTLITQYYTGVPKAMIKRDRFNVVLKPVKSEVTVMPVSPEEYLPHIVEQVSFQICVMARVLETKQVFVDQEDFRLRRPDVELKAPKSLKRGEKFDLELTVTNTLPEPLTHCEWQIEAPGIQRNKKIKHGDVEPYGKTSITVSLRPRRLGNSLIAASFQSNELMDVTGELEVKVY